MRVLWLFLFLAGLALAQSAPPPGAVPTCEGKPSDPASCITPPRATYSPNPTYDEASRDAKIEGTVEVSIIVTSDGQVKHPEIVKSLSEGLDKRAIEAVSQWKFVPATKGGKPIAIQIVVDCTFKIK